MRKPLASLRKGPNINNDSSGLQHFNKNKFNENKFDYHKSYPERVGKNKTKTLHKLLSCEQV